MAEAPHGSGNGRLRFPHAKSPRRKPEDGKPPSSRYVRSMLDLFAENAGAFLLVSVVLGGGAAWLAGRAIAQTWRPWWQGMLYMFVLGAAVRFTHFALFDGTLTDLAGYARDTAVAIAFAAAGFRTTRARQMARQYGFLAKAAAPEINRAAPDRGQGQRNMS